MQQGGAIMNFRKLISSLFFGCIIMGSFVHGECAEWKLFYIVSEGPKYYFDKESIVTPQKDVIQVWFKTTTEEGSDETEQYSAHVELNCKTRSHKILEESVTDTTNKEEKGQQSSGEKPMQKFAIESVFGSLWTNVCPNR